MPRITDAVRRLAPLAALLIAACASQPPPPPPAVALENTEWRLTEVGGARALNGSTLRLETVQIQVRGNTGCNGYFGRFEIEGERLRFGPIAATRRACTDPEMNRQESAFLQALDGTRAWRIAGNTLVLRGEDGDLARFTAQPRK